MTVTLGSLFETCAVLFSEFYYDETDRVCVYVHDEQFIYRTLKRQFIVFGGIKPQWTCAETDIDDIIFTGV